MIEIKNNFLSIRVPPSTQGDYSHVWTPTFLYIIATMGQIKEKLFWSSEQDDNGPSKEDN
jgi:hypothetical protein